MDTNTDKTQTGQLPRIDFNTGTFTANGTNYTIHQFLSIERYCEFQILEKELGYGFTFKEIYAQLDQAEKALNKTQFTTAAVTINNIKTGVLKVQQREPVALKICALFINADDEDIKEFNADVTDKKINDWKKEGIAMNDFFTVALNSINGFLGIYQNITRNITEVLEKKPGEKTAN